LVALAAPGKRRPGRRIAPNRTWRSEVLPDRGRLVRPLGQSRRLVLARTRTGCLLPCRPIDHLPPVGPVRTRGTRYALLAVAGWASRLSLESASLSRLHLAGRTFAGVDGSRYPRRSAFSSLVCLRVGTRRSRAAGVGDQPC